MSNSSLTRAVLLLSCPDARGIVADVSHFIYTYGGNIIHSSQHNDPETDTFFMRVEWDITGFAVTADLDQGPIIEQDVARITHRDRVEDLVQRGRNLERVVLSRAVELHLEHRVLVFKNKTIVFD